MSRKLRAAPLRLIVGLFASIAAPDPAGTGRILIPGGVIDPSIEPR